MPPKPKPTIALSSSLLSAGLSTPPPFMLSKSPYSCIPLPAFDGLPPDHGDTLAHSHPSNSAFCTDPLPPRTPPPVIHARSPYCCIPLPPQIDSSTEVSINPVLAITRKPLINFDLSLPPSYVTTPHCHERCLFEPATHPMLPSLTVISPLLPWPITIHKSSINPAFITVADVLGTIYGAVQTSVKEDEFEYLGSHPAVRSGGGEYTYHGRKARGAHRRDRRRLDFFGGKNRFLGLSKSSMGWDTWVLNVE